MVRVNFFFKIRTVGWLIPRYRNRLLQNTSLENRFQAPFFEIKVDQVLSPFNYFIERLNVLSIISIEKDMLSKILMNEEEIFFRNIKLYIFDLYYRWV